METVDVQLVQKWMRQRIMFDQATITYRDLANQASCEIDRARKLLEEFCDSEDAKRLKVEPTYLIFGNVTKLVGDSIKTSKVERARASELEEFKSKFDSVSYVQIHSISATQAPDPNLLKSYTEARITLQQPKSIKNSTTEPPTTKERKDADSESSKKKERSSSGTKKNQAEEAKSSIQSKLNNKRKEGGDYVPEKPATTSGTTQSKPNLAKPTKAPNHKNDKPQDDVEDAVTVPAKRPASEVDHRKDTADKKSKTDSPKTTTTTTATSKLNSKKSKQEEEEDGEADKRVDSSKEPLGRKRVTKTRMIKKKKIVRVKDKKGYRVNREEIEEIEETYSDWESTPPPSPSSSKKNKKAKVIAPSGEDGHDGKEEAKRVEPSTTTRGPPSSSKPPTQSIHSSKIPPPHQPAKKKPPSSTKQHSKEQSNITSFFKKT